MFLKHHCRTCLIIIWSVSLLLGQQDLSTYKRRAATVLSEQFDTVIYTHASLLESAEVLNAKRQQGQLGGPEQSLRLPLLELIAAFTVLRPAFISDLKQSSDSILIGAKDFKQPEGLGMATSTNYYVAVLKPDIHSTFTLGNEHQTIVEGRQAWSWSLAPFEGHPEPIYFYAAIVSPSYFVMTNDQKALWQVANRLTSSSRPITSKFLSTLLPHMVDINNFYWAYRIFKHPEIKEQNDVSAVTAKNDETATALLIDAQMKTITIEVAGSGSDKRPPQIISTLVPNIHRYREDTWEGTYLLNREASTDKLLFQLMAYFGFQLIL